MASTEDIFLMGEHYLQNLYGEIDSRSQAFDFTATDYYEKEMGLYLKRKFISFSSLIPPESISRIKIETNSLEDKIRSEHGAKNRIINLDPGYLTTSALIMATAKNFSHRVPLKNGIYAHLELLFGKNDVRHLEWTYPDIINQSYHDYFRSVRKTYLSQLQKV